MGTVGNYPALRASALMAIGIVAGNALGLSLAQCTFLLAVLVVLVVLISILTPRFASLLDSLTFAVVVLWISLGATKLAFDQQRSVLVPPKALIGSTLIVGSVSDLPSVASKGVRFVVRTSSLVVDGTSRPFVADVLVSVVRLGNDTLAASIRHGNLIAVRGELTVPSEERNPGEFSERQYYEANGIQLLMRADAKDLVLLDGTRGSWLMSTIVEPARRYILTSIDTTIGGEEGEFLKGLLIGVRSGLSPSVRQAFTHAGVAHVLAVSGSNVAVVAGILFLVLEFLRLPRWVRLLATGLGVLFYMLVTGSQPPVVRATIMALVFLAAGIVQEKRNAYNALGLSALVILLIDARQLFDVGFQLSFAAVFSILALYPRVNQWIGSLRSETLLRRGLVWILQVCGVSAVATFGTFPLTALYFGKVSIIGILANVVVLPMVGLSVALGCTALIAGLFSQWLAGVYATANQVLLHMTLAITNIAGNLPMAYVDTVRFTMRHAIPLFIVILLVINLQRKERVRLLVVLLLISLNVVAFAPDSPVHIVRRGTMRVSVIDVGQGDAILVEFPDGKTMLVDAGPTGPSFDAGERIVAPFLRRRAISAINLLLVSHPHSDHLGGVPALLEEFDVQRVVDNGWPINTSLYARYLANVRDERCRFESVRAGSVLKDFDGVRVYVFAPTSMDSLHASNLNNASIAIKLQYGNVTFLLPGDAEEEEEHGMVEIYGDFLHANVLKAGHHGSSTSSTEPFLDVVRPSQVVISVGRRNKFGHPSPSVVERFATRNVAVLRTDEEGAVILETDGESLTRIDWR